jgi:hypothetical protein
MSVVGTPKSAEQIQHDWDTNPRWKDISRSYTAQDVVARPRSAISAGRGGRVRLLAPTTTICQRFSVDVRATRCARNRRPVRRLPGPTSPACRLLPAAR